MASVPFVINTQEKPALYPGVKIQIDGKEYLARRSTRPMWRKLRELEDRIKKGDFTAYYEQIEIMTNAPAEAVDNLDVEEVKQIIEYIIERTQNPAEGMDNAEKKVLPPGPKKRPESPETSPDSSTPKT